MYDEKLKYVYTWQSVLTVVRQSVLTGVREGLILG